MYKEQLKRNIDIININICRAHRAENAKEVERLEFELYKQNQDLIKILQSENTLRTKTVEKNIEQSKEIYKKVLNVESRGRKKDGTSYTMLILKSLKDENIKSLSSAVNKVDEWKPGRNKKKIETQMKTIIRLVQQQKLDRWKKYSWDEDNFLMREK